MIENININIKSIFGSLAIIAFLILLFGIEYKYYYPNSEMLDNVFIEAAIMLGFVISIGIYTNTDLGLIQSFTIGYMPAFIMLGFITWVGRIFLILDLLVLLIVILLKRILR